MRKPDVDPAALQDLVTRVYGRRAVRFSRTPSGTTTQVYRLESDLGVHYLRVAEDRPDRFGAELLVLELARDRGARLPAIIHYEPFDPALDRSILITTGTTGRSIDESFDPNTLRDVLFQAGRDLAAINSIPVDGFGFINRTETTPSTLTADYPDPITFVANDFPSDLTGLPPGMRPGVDRRLNRAVAIWQSDLAAPAATLAHGDLDATHIYADGGQYAGIIDFGEIRGADRGYDLGHFAVHTALRLPDSAPGQLLSGYRSVAALDDADLCRMHFWTVCIGLRVLARATITPTHRLGLAGRIEEALDLLV